MTVSTILSGFGGQGLLFAGQVLAQAALREGRHVTWLPSYGPEMRGGAASCTVVVSDRPIGSPIVDVADVLIALSPPSLARYERLVAAGGLIVLNSSLIEAVPQTDADVVRVPCSAIATDAGDDRAVSIAALGAVISLRPMVSAESIRTALRMVAAKAGPEAVERDIRAFEAGFIAAQRPEAAERRLVAVGA